MPQRKNAIKALRKNRTNHMHNLDIKTDLKKTIHGFASLIKDKKTKEARDQLKLVFKKIDKAAKRNILHKNTAARRKSHFAKLLTSIA